MTSRKSLTDAAVSSAKPTDRQYEIADGKVTGLSLRVAPGGARTFALRYRTATGEQRRLTLGRYPVVTLAHARDLALRALAAVADGEDPAQAKRAARAATRAGNPTTVADLIEICLKAARTGHHRHNGRPQRASTLALEHDTFARLITPRLGQLTIHQLSQSALQAFLDEVYAITPAGARNCHALIRLAFNVAIRRELTTLRNPAQFVSLPRAPARERVLNDDELSTVWRATIVPAPGLAPGTRLAIRLAMVTLQRGGEVVGIHARELDRDKRLWTLPGERTKNHRPHVVPLSPLAIALLDQAFALAGGGESSAWRGYAFPSRQRGTPITRLALSAAVGRLMTAAGIADATAHDFRRTGATNLTGEGLNIPRFVVSRVLNQISDTGGAAAVTGVYDRNEYLSDKRRALDAWAAHLGAIVGDGQMRTPARAAAASTGGGDITRIA